MKRAGSRGVSIARGAPDFDATLLGTSFNAQDPGRRPDLIVQANDTHEVIAAVNRARAEGLTIGICSGGHSWAQNHIRDGGMLLDLSRLNSIAINEADATATIGPGCLAGELNAAHAKCQLFFPVAHAYTVGMGVPAARRIRLEQPGQRPGLPKRDRDRCRAGRWNAGSCQRTGKP